MRDSIFSAANKGLTNPFSTNTSNNQIIPLTSKCLAWQYFLSGPSMIRILSYQVTGETLEAIRERFRLGDFRIKVASMIAFKKIGGWSVLPDLIHSLLDENADVRKFGWQLLGKLRTELTRLFIPANDKDFQRARHSLQNVRVNYNLEMSNWQDALLKNIAFFIRLHQEGEISTTYPTLRTL